MFATIPAEAVPRTEHAGELPMMRIAIASLTAALAIAGPVRADALQDQVLAAAKADKPPAYGFRRAIALDTTGQKSTRFVELYDPHKPAADQWSLVSIDGRAPEAKDLKRSRQVKREPMPGYAQAIDWFGAPATRIASGPDSVTYRFARLPKGAFKIGGHDASEDAQADVVVNIAGRFPFVESVKMSTAKPFGMMLVAKVKSATVSYSFVQLPDGHVMLAATNSSLSGSMMGKSGDMRSAVIMSDYRPML
jgi:hypothetical protein